MNQRPVNDVPPWRSTPLEHWSTDIDPVIMSGDEWVENSASKDPGSERIQEQHGGTGMAAPFMHPMHDTNFGLENDVFTSEGEE